MTFTDASALAAARRADDDLARGNDRGPLQGVPLGIKDILATADEMARTMRDCALMRQVLALQIELGPLRAPELRGVEPAVVFVASEHR